MTALRRGEPQGALIVRAGMDGPTFNTSVVQSTDDTFRISVGRGYLPFLDCVSVGVMVEGQRTWNIANLSPARARILAMHLLRIAAMQEKRAGLIKIDKASPRT